MQLSDRLARPLELALVSSLLLLTRGAVADTPVVRAGTEVAAYRDSFATAVLTPSISGRVESPTAGWSAQGRYIVDVVSAASPDVVATASPRWSETRHAGNAELRYKPGALGGSIGGNVSYTPDYFSRGVQGSAVLDLDAEKLWTITAGAGYAHDTIGRTGTPFSVFSRELDTFSASLGLSHVVGPRTLASFAVDGIAERGDSSKPYRYVPIFAPADVARVERGATVADVARLRINARPLEQLPLSRERLALTGRLAHRFDGWTLRAEERFYGDTWGMPASTTDLRLLFDIGDRVIAGPTMRGHVQGATGFYRRAYASNGPQDIPIYRTGDRELGALFSLSGGGSARLGLAARPEPMSTSLGFMADVTSTWFADAIYATHRFAALVALSFEVRF